MKNFYPGKKRSPNIPGTRRRTGLGGFYDFVRRQAMAKESDRRGKCEQIGPCYRVSGINSRN